MSLLGIDIGTTGCKAIVFDTYGKMLASSYKEYGLIISKEGLVEYDPEEVLKSIKAIIKGVNSNPQVIKDPIEAFSLSVSGDEVLPVNKNGKALYNMICSLDSRGIEENLAICEKVGVKNLYDITGLPPSNMYALNRILWFKSNAGEIYDNISTICPSYDVALCKLSLSTALDSFGTADKYLDLALEEMKKLGW